MKKKRHLAIKKLWKRIFLKRCHSKQECLEWHRKCAPLHRRLEVMLALAEGKKPPPNLEKRHKRRRAVFERQLADNDFSGAIETVGLEVNDWGDFIHERVELLEKDIELVAG